MSWDVDQYERFKTERAQPFRDLAALIEPRPSMRIIDLGCGTGDLTRELHEQLGASETLGLDSSESMLQKASPTNTLHFQLGDIASFTTDRPFDLVFSNAALHWIAGHKQLFARLVSLLAPNGQLAFQMPANHDHPSHRIAAEVATSFGIEPRTVNVLPPESYATLLHHLGFARQHVRLQVYGHVLPSTADVVEWTKGSTLTPYREALPSDRYAEFLTEYTNRLVAALGDSRPYFYTFKRILLWATR
ncbi:MAG: methyltransferase domain-containing protein [Acidobacteria bacterium]|nr:methyltransferase domain-containing protein [Acidobacteriota bacterium]MBV9067201.1 methyltransferase domain-containing protein [Acidobacteriota bacterium]MBV9184265.1 methyltransferase domain-containing protein [Acidobacteriota bacterium]